MPRKWTADELDDLVGKVLTVLPAPDARPMSTPTVRRKFPGLDTYERENYVRRALDKLVDAEWAEKSTVVGDNRVFWRRTPAGEEGKRRGALPPDAPASRP